MLLEPAPFGGLHRLAKQAVPPQFPLVHQQYVLVVCYGVSSLDEPCGRSGNAQQGETTKRRNFFKNNLFVCILSSIYGSSGIK